MTTGEIRKKFLEYFAKNEHKVVDSAPVITHRDPTLLFTNAGMVPFKDVFLGLDQRGYNRATSSQKCLRVGGKHNDLENVGHTARHQTFFEMLGNFSFGDYFKKEAIHYGWEFLTKEVGLNPEHLYPSIHHSDREALELWQSVTGIAKEKILIRGDEDNFWSMGDTGPCGPCSEIHYDLSEGKVEINDNTCGDTLMEVWNLVFMQYDRDEKGNLSPLPRPSIDTGMGLERISMVASGKRSNYETDVLRSLIGLAEKLCQIKYGENEENDTALRVLADHSRSCAFLITESINPSNEGRGYVLRRLIRRALRFGNTIALPNGGFSKIAGLVADLMGDHYTDLHKSKSYFMEVLGEEEERFNRTLNTGLSLLNKEMEESKNKTIDGSAAFKLYDTYGFPLDLTMLIAKEKGFEVETQDFEKLMAKQKKQSFKKNEFSQSGDDFLKELYSKIGDTSFLGYEKEKSDAEVLALFNMDGPLRKIAAGEEGFMVLNQSPCYAESGGQVADICILTSESDLKADIMDAQKRVGSMIAHKIKVVEGELNTGEQVEIEVNHNNRNLIRANHSATHLLHSVLREVLGEHVKQAGSLVEADRLRFDFNHHKSLTKKEIQNIENRVNQHIQGNYLVETKETDMDSAKSAGAVAIFDEKYGDSVRMVRIGPDSLELCGGTHVSRSGDIGLFKILTEASISAGIRRIEAVTSEGAFDLLLSQSKIAGEISVLLGSSIEDSPQKVKDLIQKNKDRQKEIEKLKEKLSSYEAEKAAQDLLEVAGIKFLVLKPADLKAQEVKSLKGYADQLRVKMGSGAVILAHETGNTFLAAATKDVSQKFVCGKFFGFLREKFPGFRGGGRPDMAQGSAGNPENLEQISQQIEDLLSQFLSN